MAAHEFYFKSPFDIEAEFPIMMVLQILAFIPLEAIGVFAYARLVGSIRGYTLLILAILLGINYLIAKWLMGGRPKASLLVHACRRSRFLYFHSSVAAVGNSGIRYLCSFSTLRRSGA